MIKATVVGDSINKQGDRITSLEVIMPRYILAEFNTHRMLSKNSASSRAIPYKKMVQLVQENPFIPIAWQKDHPGMQGTEYFTDNMDEIPFKTTNGTQLYANDPLEFLNRAWLKARDNAIETAFQMNSVGATKQMVNRQLEAYMYHKVLVTGTEWENFFQLRCPEYSLFYEQIPMSFRSRKDLLAFVDKVESPEFKKDYDDLSEVDWLKANKGQADIHMMATAEAIWDAMNESKPKLLQPGEWHIPYIDNIKNMEFAKFFGAANPKAKSFESSELYKTIIKISTGMAARTSYTTVGDEKEIKYETLIGIHDKMIEANPFHASPFEHCAPAMTDEEYASYIKGHVKTVKGEQYGFILYDTEEFQKGWCRNFRGFIQYRELIENGKL